MKNTIKNRLLRFRNLLLAGFGLLLVAGCSPKTDDIKTADAETMLKDANALVDNDKYEEAVALFDQVIAMNPNNWMAYNGKAVAFDHSGNHRAAQDIYKTALLLSPDSVKIKNNLAMSLVLSNQPKQAIELLEPLVNNVDDGEIVRHNLAMAYGVAGQKEKAMKLNLRDMSKKQALENQRIYDEMIAHNRKKSKSPQSQESSASESRAIGFISASASTDN